MELIECDALLKRPSPPHPEDNNMAALQFGKAWHALARHRHAMIVAVCVLIAAGLFAAVMENVVHGDALAKADVQAYNFLQQFRTPGTDRLMVAMTELGDTLVVTLVTVSAAAWLAVKRAWQTALHLGVAVGGASAFNTAIKLLTQRARPVPDLYGSWSAFSFPSGHATVNAVLYGFLGFLVARHMRTAGRAGVAAAGLAWIGAVVLSRLYLGAHWLSDVAGSLAFALAWTVALGASHVARRSQAFNPRALAVVAGITLALAGGFNVWHRHELDMQRYGARPEILPTIEIRW